MPEVIANLNQSTPLSLNEAVDSAAQSRILVIDDEAGIRESLEILLTLEGYNVEMAVDGESGLLMLE